MRWEDERYVRVYTKDTAEWLALGWKAQALFLFTLRRADRAGLVHTGRAGPRGLAALVGMPFEVVSDELPLLLADGCLTEVSGAYLIPNFIAAQEAHASDAQRQREKRQRDRDRAIADAVTKRDDKSQNVTPTSTQSRGVTDGAPPSRNVTASVTNVTPSRAVPSRAVPSEEEERARKQPALVVTEKPSSPSSSPKSGPVALIPFQVEAPTTPPRTWTAEEFWCWAQSQRVEAGLLTEKWPRLEGLNAWYSAALMDLNGEVETLQEAFGRFGQSEHWEQATPPFPWSAFQKLWRDFVPQQEAETA